MACTGPAQARAPGARPRVARTGAAPTCVALKYGISARSARRMATRRLRSQTADGETAVGPPGRPGACRVCRAGQRRDAPSTEPRIGIAGMQGASRSGRHRPTVVRGAGVGRSPGHRPGRRGSTGTACPAAPGGGIDHPPGAAVDPFDPRPLSNPRAAPVVSRRRRLHPPSAAASPRSSSRPWVDRRKCVGPFLAGSPFRGPRDGFDRRARPGRSRPQASERTWPSLKRARAVPATRTNGGGRPGRPFGTPSLARRLFSKRPRPPTSRGRRAGNGPACEPVQRRRRPEIARGVRVPPSRDRVQPDRVRCRFHRDRPRSSASAEPPTRAPASLAR